jgi:hypothetical protein
MCRIFVCGFCCRVGRIVNYVTKVAAKATDKKTSEIGILINASFLTLSRNTKADNRTSYIRKLGLSIKT